MTRGRKPKTDRGIPTNLHLPESVRTKIDLLLFSELERRVPVGAYQRFFLRLLDAFFETTELDLSPYVGSLPGTHIIRGRPHVLQALINALHSQHQEIHHHGHDS